MWKYFFIPLLSISITSTQGSPEANKESKNICGTENWTTINLKIIQDENDIKRIASNKCAIVLQNPPNGKLTESVISLLPKQSLKILQISGKLTTIDEGSIASLRYLKLLKLSNVDLEDSEVVEGEGVFTKNVEYIDLSKNGLNNLKFFKTESKNVKRLNLEQNDFTTVPEELNVFEKLEELNMTKNKISDISVKFTFTFVHKLDLSSNFVSNLSGLHLFPNVQILHLESNNINSLNDIRYEYFLNERTSLKEVYLDNNIIEVLPIRTLFMLPNLMTFSLSNNKLRNLIPTTKKYRNTKLEYLDLGNNKLDDIPYNFLKWFPSLKTLKINNNKLDTIRTSTFANLNNLLNLDISYNKISNFDVKRLIPLESLTILNITNNTIENIDYFSLISDVPNLKTISIDENPLLCENLVKMLNFFESREIEVAEGHCEGREHIRRICCVDNNAKNHTDSKFNMASYSLFTQNRENFKKLDDLLEAIKNISEVNNKSDTIRDESIVITKVTFWTGFGIIIAALFSILIVLIVAVVMKKREALPVHL